MYLVFYYQLTNNRISFYNKKFNKVLIVMISNQIKKQKTFGLHDKEFFS